MDMDAAAEADFYHGTDTSALPADLLDADMPLASFHDLNNLLQDLRPAAPWFVFSNLESSALEPGNHQIGPSPSTDIASDDSDLSSAPRQRFNAQSDPVAAHSQDDQPCRNKQGSCVHLATRVLRSMHRSSQSCILGVASHGSKPDRQPWGAVGADTILSMVQGALEAIRSILHCPCCRIPQVLLLATVVCSKVGASYRQLVDIYARESKAEGKVADQNSKSNGTESRRRSIFIGNHRLSPSVEAALIHQILLGTLQELEGVVGEFINCMEQEQAFTGGDPTADAMRKNVRMRMVELLRARLRTLTFTLGHMSA